MDQFVVRTKRVVEAPSSKHTKRARTAGAGHTAAAAAAAAGPAAARSFPAAAAPSPLSSSRSSSASFTPRPLYAAAPAAPLKQLQIEHLSKVTSVDDVKQLALLLSCALEQHDWARVHRHLQQLKLKFISKTVLEKTEVGKLMCKIKKVLKANIAEIETHKDTQAAEPAAAPAAAAALPAAPVSLPLPLPLPVDPEVDEEEELLLAAADPRPADADAAIDLTARSASSASSVASDATDNDKQSPAASAASSSSSAAAAASPSASASAADLPALLSSCFSLALELLVTWKSQAVKEINAEQVTGASGSGPALDFSAYSTFKSRRNLYRALYYRLALHDVPETRDQSIARKQRGGSLVAKEADMAAVAAALESALFRMHRDKQADLRIQAKRGSTELLSSTPAAGATGFGGRVIEEPLHHNTEPPRYAGHARVLVDALTRQPSLVPTLRALAGHPDDEHRRRVIAKVIDAAPSYL